MLKDDDEKIRIGKRLEGVNVKYEGENKETIDGFSLEILP